MSAICPFKNKYEQVIKEAYPKIKIVIGTHTGNEKLLQDCVKHFFSTDMAGLYKEHLSKQAQS